MWLGCPLEMDKRRSTALGIATPRMAFKGPWASSASLPHGAPPAWPHWPVHLSTISPQCLYASAPGMQHPDLVTLRKPNTGELWHCCHYFRYRDLRKRKKERKKQKNPDPKKICFFLRSTSTTHRTKQDLRCVREILALVEMFSIPFPT